jgi:hypothetical protein
VVLTAVTVKNLLAFDTVLSDRRLVTFQRNVTGSRCRLQARKAIRKLQAEWGTQGNVVVLNSSSHTANRSNERSKGFRLGRHALLITFLLFLASLEIFQT